MEYTDVKVTTSADAVAASLETNLTGTNNDLRFVAKNKGTDGNDITIDYVDGAGNNIPLTVDVTGDNITVNLATDGSSAPTSTANDIKAAIEADVDANALVTVTLKTGNDGTGVATAMAATDLDGGSNVQASASGGVSPATLRGIEVIWADTTPDTATVTVTNMGRNLLTAAPKTDGDVVFYPVAEEMVDASQTGATQYQKFTVHGTVAASIDLGDTDATDDALNITDAVVVRLHME